MREQQPMAAATDAATPQQALASILARQRPDSLAVFSLNPVPDDLQQWCQQHNCQLLHLSDPAPANRLPELPRLAMVLVADQLEYMTEQAGRELIGQLRHLHTDQLLVVYQPALAAAPLRWSANGFLAMGLRCLGRFRQGERELAIYGYQLDSYNFTRSWNNSRHWANPENWGKYWW